ncbi:hypothetical protein TWF506_001934 [Arthrobotrys conoides]|uniref:Serine protease inhibitor n=1 Tax=Arthrobotrys conoides TaxID=74498 RepID=A0AAN8RZ14_9PEZI
MAEQLSSGIFRITGTSSEGTVIIGRHSREDRSLNPKPIYPLEGDEVGPNATWEIEHQNEDEYILRCHGAPVASHDQQLFAILTEHHPPTVWKITKQAQGGYTIVVADDSGLGWVLPFIDEGDNKPIAVRPLIVQPSYPPRFPPNELFKFEKL